VKEVCGLGWSHLLALIGLLSVLIIPKGDTRQYILQGAVAGSFIGLIFMIMLFQFVAPH
jgi:hypothetical protein